MKLRERPRAERVRVRIPVEISLRDRTYPGDLVDLSLTGAFVETAAALAPGLRAELRVRIGGRDPLRVRARIARRGTGARPVAHPGLHHLSVRVSGVALTFEGLDERTAGELRALIALTAEADV